MGTLATSHMTVEVSGGPHRGYVCIAGEVDLAGEKQLIDALGQLATLHSHTVSIDLGGVTFAGSSLLNFLTRVSMTMPANTPLRLCRSTAMTRRLIQVAGLEQTGILS